MINVRAPGPALSASGASPASIFGVQLARVEARPNVVAHVDSLGASQSGTTFALRGVDRYGTSRIYGTAVLPAGVIVPQGIFSATDRDVAEWQLFASSAGPLFPALVGTLTTWDGRETSRDTPWNTARASNVASAALRISPGRVRSLHFSYGGAAGVPLWVHTFDAAAVPANGTVPSTPPLALTVAPAFGFDDYEGGLTLVNGLSVAASSTYATLTLAAAADFFLLALHGDL